MNYVFVTNEQANKGYSSSVKAMADSVHNPMIVDAADFSAAELPAEATLVSAGNMGYELLLHCAGHPMILATDRYGYEDLDALDTPELTVIAPQCELGRYAAVTKRSLRLVAADLVAAPSADVLKGYAYNFITDNEDKVADALFEAHPEYFFFFGGRVAAPTAEDPNAWKENSVVQFEETAEKLMLDAHGRNVFCVFHGLRSRTRGDKSNDFAPQQAAIDKMSRMRNEFQSVLVLAVTEDGPTLIVMNDEGMQAYPVKNNNAGGYYAAIRLAVKTDARMVFTAEQMNFVNEALTLGAYWRRIRPFGTEDGWLLTVPANEATHDNVFAMLKRGETPMTQVQAFRNLVG